MGTQQKTYVQNDRNLYIFNPSTNEFSLIGATGASLTDIAALSNGSVFGVDFSSTYSIDTSTGRASFLKSLSRSDINALGADSNGQLYCAGANTTTIYKLNALTGTMTAFATASSGSAGDLLVLNGKLWLATNAATLESFDLTSGAKIDSIYHGINYVYGLSISDTGQLYGFADTKAYVFDLGTGATREVANFPIGQSVYGASPAAPNWQQWYTGSSTNDLLPGSNGNDLVSGLDGNDTLDGLLGNDHLIGGAGNDKIDGGGGVDTAIYVGSRPNYSQIKTASVWTVTSISEGTDTLQNVERLKFSDTTIALDIDGNGGQAYRVYQAAFNRTPDSGGLGFWINAMDSGASLRSVAEGFVGSAEFKALYGTNPTNAQIVTKLYDNVLHRAGESGGFNFWLGILDSKAETLAGVLAAFSESAENQAGLVGVIGNGFAFTPYV